jgi:hypothetical protein
MEISVIDLGGRLQTSSIQGGSWYWMIILDKREGWRDVYFLKNKSDAADIIIRHDQRSIRRMEIALTSSRQFEPIMVENLFRID